MPNPENLTPHQFKPGQSGNPNGYSRGRRATDELLKQIDERTADAAIARRWLQAILEGDFRYFKEYIDRVEGKVPDRIAGADGESPVKHEHTHRLSLSALDDDELDTLGAIGRKLAGGRPDRLIGGG